jgi:predicted branched-subunit amino acid permease
MVTTGRSCSIRTVTTSKRCTTGGVSPAGPPDRLDFGEARFRAGIRRGLPFGLAVFAIAISFGVLARPVMGSVAPIVMSVLVFSGAAQFGSLAILVAGGGAGAAIAAGVLLNARYLAMGIALAPSLRGRPLSRAAFALTTVDASWAAATIGEGRFDPWYMVGATVPQYPAWVLGTVVGVLAGGALGDPRALGLDALFPAFFVGLLFEEVRGRRRLAAAGGGAATALALTPFSPAGLPILVAAVAAVAASKVRP